MSFLLPCPNCGPRDVNELKRAAQAIARPIYRAQRVGNVVSADRAIEARFNEALARGAATAERKIPGVAAINRRIQGLIGLGRTVTEAELRRRPILVRAGVPLAGGAVAASLPGTAQERELRFLTGLLGVHALASPRVTSRLALLLSNPGAQALLRQAPRVVGAGIGYDSLDSLGP